MPKRRIIERISELAPANEIDEVPFDKHDVLIRDPTLFKDDEKNGVFWHRNSEQELTITLIPENHPDAYNVNPGSKPVLKFLDQYGRILFMPFLDFIDAVNNGKMDKGVIKGVFTFTKRGRYYGFSWLRNIDEEVEEKR